MPRLRSLAALAALAAVLTACKDRRPDVPTAALVETMPASASSCSDPEALPVDTVTSVVRWKGTKFAGRGKHEGTVRVSDGHVEVCGGALVGGAFTIDMTSIAVTDIPAHEKVPRQRLTDHLLADDFFAVETYPTARFEISSVAPASPPAPDSVRITGALTLRGQTREIAFGTHLGEHSTDGIQADAQFGIDRRLWGVDFTGSDLTNDLVDDVIYLDVRLVARR